MKQDKVAMFCRALWRGEEDVVERLAPVVDPNGRDRWGARPLLMAAQFADLPVVSLLIERGAEIEQGRRLLTPLTIAARRNEPAIVAYLRKEGAVASIFTWVHLGDDKRVAKELDRQPALAQLRDELGTPILHHAVE